MIRTLILTCCFTAAGAFAQSPTTQPAGAQPKAGDAPKSTVRIVDGHRTSGDKDVDATLDKLEARGKAAKAIEAEIQYDFITPGPIVDMEDKQTKLGKLLFVQSGKPQFLVHFVKKMQGGIVNRSPEYYAFDGQWLTERNDRSKTVIRREIVKPDQHVDLFDLGKGPFPLPFGRSRAEMLRYFEIRLHENHADQPIKLRCLPREGTDLAERYRYVDLFVDRKLDLPTRVVCQRKIDDNRIEVSFANIKELESIDSKQFDVPVPTGFQVTEEPLRPPPGQTAGGEMPEKR